MRAFTSPSRWIPRIATVAVLLFALGTSAFPPAPHHVVFGLVRDELGHPLENFGAQVLLDVGGVTVARTTIATGFEAGVNYRLTIPLDSGATADLYKATALRPTVPFRMRVRIGNAIYLPIEMSGAGGLLTRPSESSRVDLTLGVDANGNGLPDAWERAVAESLGRPLGEFGPEDPYPGRGMSYREVYLAGLYDVAPDEGFALQIIPDPALPAKLAFTAVRGRSYTLQAASNLGEWQSIPFRVLPLSPDSAPVDTYHAAETRRLEVSAAAVGDAPARFFRLIVR